MKWIEKKIEKMASYDVPDVLHRVMSETPPLKSRRLKPALSFAFGILLIGLLSLPFLVPTPVEASTVYLDFDAALSIGLNDEDEVISIAGTNPEGEALVAILKTTHAWRNASLETVMDQLLITLETAPQRPDHGTIMYSVRSRSDLAKSRVMGKLQAQLVRGQSPLFDDLVDGDSFHSSEPESTGMMANPMRDNLIQTILENDPTEDLENLSTLSMPELIQQARRLGIFPGRP
jgi:hypothetical protein